VVVHKALDAVLGSNPENALRVPIHHADALVVKAGVLTDIDGAGGSMAQNAAAICADPQVVMIEQNGIDGLVVDESVILNRRR